MTIKSLFLTMPLMLTPILAMAQGGGVAPAELLKPLRDSWPTYNGDYSGKRYSALTQVNQSNVQHLTIAWMTRVTPGVGTAPGAGGRGGRGGGNFGGVANIITGGEGPGDIAVGGGTIKASALQVDGTLYFTMPDNAWAVDARDARANVVVGTLVAAGVLHATYIIVTGGDYMHGRLLLPALFAVAAPGTFAMPHLQRAADGGEHSAARCRRGRRGTRNSVLRCVPFRLAYGAQ